MDIRRVDSVKDLVSQDAFYLLMLNSGLPFSMYGLSKKFVRNADVNVTPLYVNEDWCAHMDDSRVILVSKRDARDLYFLQEPFFLATKLHDKEGSDPSRDAVDIWSDRICFFSSRAAEEMAALLHEKYALANFKKHRSCTINLDFEWLTSVLTQLLESHNDARHVTFIKSLSATQMMQMLMDFEHRKPMEAAIEARKNVVASSLSKLTKTWSLDYAEAVHEMATAQHFNTLLAEEDVEVEVGRMERMSKKKRRVEQEIVEQEVE